MTDAVPMVEVWRGDIAESHHRGHAVVCDAAGAVRAAWGDPDAVILPRSSCKMLQALPLVESGAADGLGSEQLALACASHSGAGDACDAGGALARASSGSPRPTCAAGRRCPTTRPSGTGCARRAARPASCTTTARASTPGFLTLNRRLGAGPEYVEIDHPVQRAVRAAFEEMCGADEPRLGHRRLLGAELRHHGARARLAMARMADPRGLGPAREAAARRLVAAMLAHPLLVAGEGRACSELMAAMRRRASRSRPAPRRSSWRSCPTRGLGVALKIEDGATRASECAIAAILVRLGAIAAERPGGGAPAEPADR